MRKAMVVVSLVVIALLSLSLGATHIEDTSNVDVGVWLFYSLQDFVRIVLTLLIFYVMARVLWRIVRGAWQVSKPR